LLVLAEKFKVSVFKLWVFSVCVLEIRKDNMFRTISAFFIKFSFHKTGFVAFILAVLVITPHHYSLLLAEPTQASTENNGDEEGGLEYAVALSKAFESAAKRITPSIVNIQTRVTTSKQLASDPLQGLPPGFQEFMERFPGFGAPPGARPPQQGPRNMPQGLGTGFIIDNSGHILTNNHVIGEADEIEVTLQDKRKFKATVVGVDPKTDLAVIKIDADNLTPAALGSSSDLRIGQWVVAAGNPFGLDNTITAGIVSAKGRTIFGGESYEDFIQTDAAINPGNSGGPLVSLSGEVVGINTAIFSRSGGYMGIGFAIPIDLAKSVVSSILKEGRVVRGWLGVVIQNLDDDLARSFNYASTKGALVSDVQSGSPAEKAGFEAGDIVVKLNSDVINDVNQLRNIVAALKPSERIEAEVIREGKRRTLRVIIGEQPAELGMSPVEEALPQEQTVNQIGVIVETLTEEVAIQLGTSRRSGVVISQVQNASIAATAGLRRSDIVFQINDKPVRTAQEFNEMVNERALKQGLRLSVESRGFSRFVFLQAGN
jgi:serine protease Do